MSFPRPLLTTLVLLMFAAICAGSANSGRDDKEESPEVKAIKRGGGYVFPLYSFKEIRTNLFDVGFLSAEIAEGANAPYIDMRLKLRSFSTGISFSLYIENRIYGSPAWDEVALPRISLNIDPITGWYYWDK